VIDTLRRTWNWLSRSKQRGLTPQSIQHDGLTRSFLLYLPAQADTGAPLPLVLLFHGGASDPEAFAASTLMHEIAEREGFIVAYPAGTAGRSGLTWSPGRNVVDRGVDDVDFARALIADLRRRCPVDPDRIYAAGLSIGGTLVYELACALSADLAAVAVVAGVMTEFDREPERPVPLLHIHGTNDGRVPLHGGRGRRTAANNEWPPVQDGIDFWCEVNRCRDEPQVVRLIQGVTGHRYNGAADVELWLVEGGYHVWPGATPTSSDQAAKSNPPISLNASEKIWSFFAAHPRRQQTRAGTSAALP
jgi:polyhydroxybutyrate depolymerase